MKLIPMTYAIKELQDIFLENRDPEQRHPDRSSWAIVSGSECMAKDGEWEYEPMPSNRDEDFFERCRYTYEEAVQALEKLVDSRSK